MNIIEIIAQDVFDKVRSRFSNLEMGDENGTVTTDPKSARFFDFDFVIEGNSLGRVSISINELGTLKLFYGQGITEGVDAIITGMWYDFLKEMRYFAKRRMLRFDTRDITKGNLNKSDFQYLAKTGTKEDNMNESSMYGSKKTSYRKLENTLLRVRHSKPVDETARGARSRNINALFIENESGERFKYPFNHLAGAKAMQRHVANGGRPYDEAGKAIIDISEQIAKLVEFKRHVAHHDGMNQEVNEIIGRSQSKLDELRRTIEGLSKQGFYESWLENLQPVADDGMVMDQATLEDYKSKFTVKTFKEDLAQYFPLIHKIMQETSEIDLDEYVGDDSEEVMAESEEEIFDDFEQVDESKGSQVVQSLVDKFYDENGIDWSNGNIYVKEPGTRVWTRGDGTRYRDAGKITTKDGSDTKHLKAFFPWLIKQPGVKHLGKLSGSFASDEKTDVYAMGGIYFTQRGHNVIDWGSVSRFKNPRSVWKQQPKQQDVVDDFSQFESWAEQVTDTIALEADDAEGFKDGDEVMYMNKPATVVGQEDDTIFIKVKGHPGTMGVPSSQIMTRSGENSKFSQGDELVYNGQKVTYVRPYANDPSQSYVTLPSGSDELVPTDDLESEQESMDNKEPQEQKVSMKEIAEVVKSFYDKETGKFPKGETGVITHIKKQFGDRAGKVAERFVEELSQSQISESDNLELEDIMKLSGLKVTEANAEYGEVDPKFLKGPIDFTTDFEHKYLQAAQKLYRMSSPETQKKMALVIKSTHPSEGDLDYMIKNGLVPGKSKFSHEESVQEGSGSFEDVLANMPKDVEHFKRTGDMTDDLYQTAYDYMFQNNIQGGRGDSYEQVANFVSDYVDMDESTQETIPELEDIMKLSGIGKMN
jgi:hypothetical protein